MSNPLLPIPGNLALPDLVIALNDRIRRLNETVTGVSAAPTGSSAPRPTSATAAVSSGGTAQILYGTHAYRVATAALPDQSLYVETDRNNLVYQVQATVWKYLAGTYQQLQSALTGLAATLGANDTGLTVYTTDTLLLYRWTGSGFVEEGRLPVLSDTHANRLSSYPSVLYGLNQEFFESDRTVRYIVQNATGQVTVSGGTTVTWTSGNHFITNGSGFNAAQWPAGTLIVIAGVSCKIASVSSSTVLTLAAPTANGSAITWSVVAGRWVFESGSMQQAWANLPTDLGENDIGFEYFDNVNSLHIWQWNGTVWTWGRADRHSGEFGQFDADPGTGWCICDGSINKTKYAGDGTRVTNFTVPDQRGFYLRPSALGSYTGVGLPAHAPALTMDPYTPAGTAPAIGSASGTFVATVSGTGVSSTTASAITAVSGGGAIVGTPAVLTGTIDTSGVPATFSVVPYYRL